MLPDGSSLQRLTETGDVRTVSWSPNGRQIAYVRDGASGQGSGGVWVMTSEGTRQRRITHPKDPRVTTLDWSPDGRYLASSGLDAVGVFVTDVRTGTVNRIGEGKLLHADPRWSGDGKAIAFLSSGRIFVMDDDGTNVRAVVGIRDPVYFDWSWANGQFVFASRRTGRGGDCYSHLSVTRLSERGPRLITTAPAARCMESRPAWSPDGHTVAFIRDGGLWLVDSAGRAREIVAHQGRQHHSIAGTPFQPDWQPPALCTLPGRRTQPICSR